MYHVSSSDIYMMRLSLTVQSNFHITDFNGTFKKFVIEKIEIDIYVTEKREFEIIEVGNKKR